MNLGIIKRVNGFFSIFFFEKIKIQSTNYRYGSMVILTMTYCHHHLNSFMSKMKQKKQKITPQFIKTNLLHFQQQQQPCFILKVWYTWRKIHHHHHHQISRKKELKSHTFSSHLNKDIWKTKKQQQKPTIIRLIIIIIYFAMLCCGKIIPWFMVNNNIYLAGIFFCVFEYRSYIINKIWK